MFKLSTQIDEEYHSLLNKYVNFFIRNKDKIDSDINAERKKEEEKQKKELPTLNKKIVPQKENKELKKLLDLQKEYEQILLLSKEVNKFNEELNSKTVKTELIIKKANELTIDDNNVYKTAHVQVINKHKKQDYCTHIINYYISNSMLYDLY